MAIATSTALIIAAVVVAVAAGASAYVSSESAAQAEEAQAKASKAQATYARAAAQQRALDEEAAAEAADAAGKAQRAQVEEAGRRRLLMTGALAGAAGVESTEGSPLAGNLEAASLIQYNAQLAEYQPKVQAWSDRVGADRARFEGQLTGGLNDYQSSLFKSRASSTRAYGTIATGVSAVGAGAGTYLGGYKPTPTASPSYYNPGNANLLY